MKLKKTFAVAEETAVEAAVARLRACLAGGLLTFPVELAVTWEADDLDRVRERKATKKRKAATKELPFPPVGAP